MVIVCFVLILFVFAWDLNLNLMRFALFALKQTLVQVNMYITTGNDKTNCLLSFTAIVRLFGR